MTDRSHENQHRAAARRALGVGFLTLVLSGCGLARGLDRRANAQATPAEDEFSQMTGAPDQAPGMIPAARLVSARDADGSLWPRNTHWSWFADDKALRRGDIVVVRIIQKTEGTQNAKTSTKRSASISAKIKYFLGLGEAVNALTDFDVPRTDENGGVNPAYDPPDLLNAQSSNSFDGTGTTERKDGLTATISAVVTDVMENGNLAIYGRQVVQVNNETSLLTVQGIVRPTDISLDNTIDSTRIANAKIEFNGSGVVSDKQKPGWVIRKFDQFWPF